MSQTPKKYIIDDEHLMQEWDWEANADLDPHKITCGSHKKAWWKCYLCGHKWQSSISHRAHDGRSCPKCHYGRWSKAKRSSFQIPAGIIQDWHPTRNGKLTPDMFTRNSRYKAWWKCHICGKEIERSIGDYIGCIDCKKQNVLDKKNLTITNPELLKEWDYEKNTKVDTYKVLASNPKKVWWICEKCGYNWEARISNRAKLKRGCPCCSNKVVVIGKNDLMTTHPELAKEWHPTKNGNLTPEKVSYGYGKKVWWLCPHGHEYQSTVNKRTNSGTNCPICYSGRQTSFAEQAFYYYIKQIYPDAISRYKAEFLDKMELDIFIPSIYIAIEYDGEAWHKESKVRREKKKYELCKKQNITLIRLKEAQGNNTDIADGCYCFPELYKEENLDYIIPKILRLIDFPKDPLLTKLYDVNIKRDRIKILEQYNTTYKKDSFANIHPNIAAEWHPSKNGKLTPNMFKPGSGHKVWWKCPICGYEYQATIGSRSRGSGCIKCGIEKATQSKRKAVNMIDPKTNKVMKTFISISDASRRMKISSGNIAAVCQGVRPKASGYIWRYADEEENKKYQKENKQLELF